MSTDDDENLDDLDCEPLVRTAKSQVAITRRLVADYQGFEENKRARFESVMTRWCDGIPLTPEMFNTNEGRSKNNIRLQAFKGFKIRLYGFDRKVASIRTFIIVEIDPAKKQDKADPRILKRAKRRIDEIGKEV